MTVLLNKTKEVLFSVLPIFLIVIILNLTVVSLDRSYIFRFSIGVVLVLIGLTLFLIGVDKGIAPLGSRVGETLVKSNKTVMFLMTTFIIGFFISLAEPGLIIYSRQVDLVTNGHISGIVLMIVVSLGIASLLAFGLYRIVLNLALHKILMILYLLMFVFAFFVEKEMIVIAFDASATTTGVLAVPFILALTYGVSHLKKDSTSGEIDSFGTIAIVSAGVIVAVFVLSLFSKNVDYVAAIEVNQSHHRNIFMTFISAMPKALLDTFLVVGPLIIIAIAFQRFVIKMKAIDFYKMLFGFTYVLVGLFLFLLGVAAGFMDIGRAMGTELAMLDAKWVIMIVAFLLGVVTVIAEPAVYVLTHQIEDVTSGFVTRGIVLVALGIGVGFAITLSVLRIYIEPLQLWHFLLPGYLLALLMMRFTPKIFVGMSFDAGGVATGPITATFILAFIQGAAKGVPNAHPVLDGFGMVAMVALIPIITLQMLGMIYKIKSRKVVKSND